jgi:transcriptional regulator with PAS, ATPase and Fis domain
MLTILDVQRQGTVQVDAQGCVTFLSRAAQRMLGIETDAVDGRDWRDSLQLSSQETDQLMESTRQSSDQRHKVSVVRARDNKVSLHLEIEVEDDPRDPHQKIFFLYDVSDLYHLRRKLDDSACYEGIVGKSDGIRRVVQLIEDLAQVESTVLIEGESGTGKELVAKVIHQRSRRCVGLFLPLNCAGLSDELAASQLFGHRKGAFTGAVEKRPGLFEAAGGGTLFLDEIGELPQRVQTTLLRVLEENAVMRLGETKLRPVNPRIIAASNRDLASEAAQGRFRSDLLYRVRVARVCLPPLRERREDIPLLVHTFLAEQGAVTDTHQIISHPQQDIVRLLRALILVGEIDSNVRQVRSAPEEVMSHHAVEVHGGRQPGEDLEVANFVHRGQVPSQVSSHRVRRFQGRPLRHIDHDLQFVLVVIRQHF